LKHKSIYHPTTCMSYRKGCHTCHKVHLLIPLWLLYTVFLADKISAFCQIWAFHSGDYEVTVIVIVI
jgi:hypothetical protein